MPAIKTTTTDEDRKNTLVGVGAVLAIFAAFSLYGAFNSGGEPEAAGSAPILPTNAELATCGMPIDYLAASKTLVKANVLKGRSYDWDDSDMSPLLMLSKDPHSCRLAVTSDVRIWGRDHVEHKESWTTEFVSDSHGYKAEFLGPKKLFY